MNRSALGIFCLVLFSSGVVLMSLPAGDENLGGVFIRSSVVLGAIWLVLPNARQVPRAIWAGIVVLAIVLIAAPRLVLWGFAVAVLSSATGFIIKPRRGRQPPDSKAP